MANWSDPRSAAAPYATGAAARAGAYDAGLRAYMLSVYNLMASGVLLTGIVAMLFAQTSWVTELFTPTGPSALGWIVALAPLAFGLPLSFGNVRMGAGTMQALFWGYAFALGLSLSTIFLAYEAGSIAQAFFATAAGFAGLSLWGYTTKRNLSGFGSFLIIGLIGLIAASLLNVFVFRSGEMDLVISAVGVLIFAGLTAYHTQMIKSIYDDVAGTEYERRYAILGAFQLYLAFVNMFLFLLRLFGSSRN